MILKEYIAKLNKIIEDNPEAANFDVVIALDNEGNKYTKVFYDPSVGHFDEDNKFHSDYNLKLDEDYFKEHGLEYESKIFNAVCIN